MFVFYDSDFKAIDIRANIALTHVHMYMTFSYPFILHPTQTWDVWPCFWKIREENVRKTGYSSFHVWFLLTLHVKEEEKGIWLDHSPLTQPPLKLSVWLSLISVTFILWFRPSDHAESKNRREWQDHVYISHLRVMMRETVMVKREWKERMKKGWVEG